MPQLLIWMEESRVDPYENAFTLPLLARLSQMAFAPHRSPSRRAWRVVFI